MRRVLKLMAATAAVTVLWCGAAVGAPCDGVLASPSQGREPLRDMGVDDLVRIRDIGAAGPAAGALPSFMAVSPNGGQVAFELIRADPQANAHCVALVVAPLRGGAAPRTLDLGEDVILSNFDFRGTTPFVNGWAAFVAPEWSPDGQSIAYLKRHAGVVQVWRATIDGGRPEVLTDAAQDVEGMAWTADGRGIIFVSRPKLAAGEAEIDREGLRGHHYDDRFFPYRRSRPFVHGPVPQDAFVFDVASRKTRAADATEAGRVERSLATGATLTEAQLIGLGQATALDGRKVTSVALGQDPLGSERRLEARLPDGRTVRCDQPLCRSRVDGLWWSPDGSEVWVLARTGWGDGSQTLFRWRWRDGRVRPILTTTGHYTGCRPAGDNLLCGVETALRPRRIELVEVATGKVRTVFDPNPDFDNLRPGIVERLGWRNAQGLEVFADLMLPPDHQPGQRHPLVIVQYESRGFLRGGTGDEYPIPLLAARGYAVLSFQRPRHYAERAATNLNDMQKAATKGWADRRSVNSALETGVRLLIERGLVDPDRIGLTGLSDGVSTGTFALFNSDIRVSAISFSSCCMEALNLMALVGPGHGKYWREQGWPSLSKPDPEFWRPNSIKSHAATFNTPMLVQAADTEYLSSLETYSLLRELKKPIDMFVFPGEYHLKWQAAHRKAVYERNLAWFDFWLLGKEDPAIARPGEIAHWRALKTEQQGAAAAGADVAAH